MNCIEVMILYEYLMLRYDDNVNDLDVFGKLKVTFKGELKSPFFLNCWKVLY